MQLNENTRSALMQTSTATIATLLFKLGLRNQFIQGVFRLSEHDQKLVGQAFTLRYIPAREDLDIVESFRDPAHPQRVAVETVPPGAVLAMDCRGDASAASAGSILVTRLQVRGAAGLVTDGGLRDTDYISGLGLSVYCGARSAPTNLTKHHAVDLNVPISCGGVAVYPGDVLFGDGDGVIVIPSHLADEVAAEAVTMEAFEEFVLGEVWRGEPVIGTYPPNEATLSRYAAHKAGIALSAEPVHCVSAAISTADG